jgi:hypothetical protein
MTAQPSELQAMTKMRDTCSVDILHTWVVQFMASVDLSNLEALTKINIKFVLRMAEQHQHNVHEKLQLLGIDLENHGYRYEDHRVCQKQNKLDYLPGQLVNVQHHVRYHIANQVR